MLGSPYRGWNYLNGCMANMHHFHITDTVNKAESGKGVCSQFIESLLCARRTTIHALSHLIS